MYIFNQFQSSAKKLKDVRYLALIALFIALKIISGRFFHISVAKNLSVGFTFIFVAVEATIIGPTAGVLSAVVTDLLGFAIFPKGIFFPGYILTAILGNFFYSFFFYDKKINIRSIILAKLCNNIITNMFIGSLWTSILYTKKTYWAYFIVSAVKNSLLLPIEIMLLILVFNALLPILNQRHLIEQTYTLPLKF